MTSTCSQIPSNIWNKCNNLSTLNTLQYLTTTHTLHSQAMKRNKVSHSLKQKTKQSTDILQQLTILTQQSKTSLITLRKPVFMTTPLLSCTVTTMVFQIHEAAILLNFSVRTLKLGQTMIRPCFNVFLTWFIFQDILVVASLTPLAVRSMPFQLSFTFLVLTLALISRWDKTSYLLITSKLSHLEPQVNMLLLNTLAILVDSIILKQGKKLPTLMKRLKRITKPFVRQ